MNPVFEYVLNSYESHRIRCDQEMHGMQDRKQNSDGASPVTLDLCGDNQDYQQLKNTGTCIHIQKCDVVSLEHTSTHAQLAAGSFNNTIDDDNKTRSVTVTSIDQPTTDRNSFACVPLEGDVLRWGKPFQIVYSDPSLPSKIFYLASVLKTGHQMSLLSCEQMAYLTEKDDCMTHWRALLPATTRFCGQRRYVLEGSPIKKNESMIIVHCMTNNMLSSERRYSILNAKSAQREYEVFCCSEFEPGLVHNLKDEFQGCKTSQTVCRKNSDFHLWVLTTPDGKCLRLNESLVDNVSVTSQRNVGFRRVMLTLRGQGTLSLVSFRQKLIREAYSTGSSLLPLTKVLQVFSNMGIMLSQDEIHVMFRENDEEEIFNSKLVNTFQLLSDLRTASIFQHDEIINRIYRTLVLEHGKNIDDVFKRVLDEMEKDCLTKIDMSVSSISENEFLEFNRDLSAVFDVSKGVSFSDFISNLWTAQ